MSTIIDAQNSIAFNGLARLTSCFLGGVIQTLKIRLCGQLPYASVSRLMTDSDEQIPTATLAERVEDFLYPNTKQVKLIFRDPQGRKFAFIAEPRNAGWILRNAQN